MLIHADSTMSVGTVVLSSAGAAFGCALAAFLILR